jgi:hypothetical protein
MRLGKSHDQVGGQDSLAHSAFLVDDCDYLHSDTIVQKGRSSTISQASRTALQQL